MRAAARLRLVIAEATHMPEVIDAWRTAGAGPSQDALAERLDALTAAGLLDIADSTVAARHLTALVCNPPQSRSFFGVLDLDDDADVDDLVTEASTPSCASTNRAEPSSGAALSWFA